MKVAIIIKSNLQICAKYVLCMLVDKNECLMPKEKCDLYCFEFKKLFFFLAERVVVIADVSGG